MHDLTGGFKAHRREVLEAIGLDGIASHGYAFQVETHLPGGSRRDSGSRRCRSEFRDRRVGNSKMKRRIVLEAAIGVPRMRLRRP